MPKKSYIDQYIEKKAKQNEIINYNEINGKFKKCQFCGRIFHPNGINKHEIYCPLNPDRKKSYRTKRKWKCRFCDLLFTYNKERNLHENRCVENPKVVIINSNLSKSDRIELLKREFPKIYNLLTPNQINEFLDKKGGEIRDE